MTSPLSVASTRIHRLAMAQKFFNFSTLRRGEGAAETGAFQRRGGGSEPQRAQNVLRFGNGQSDRAMENIAGAQCIHGMHGKCRRLLQVLVLVEPKRALRAP